YYRKHLGQNFWAFLAEDDGRPAGAAFLSVYERPANPGIPNGLWGEVSNVFIYPEYRKRGLATALMQRLITLARERGVSRLDLSATEAGRPVYEKLGFSTDAAHTRMQLRLEL
ncbi:MAG: GNAT family N-acetyltransferase, partial [Candidatus Adiutrix sp.]|nr:GNAT family N-acetyltransferase [Candidatus Adiutrix sp.]